MATLLTHPDLDNTSNEFEKWRYAYEGGRPFVDTYLEQFSVRESSDEFQSRRRISYCPRFAGAGIDDIKNSIYQRINDVSRIGGSDSYRSAIEGNDGGVDLSGNSMNSFFGCSVLLELLIMGKVGVYIDMPPVTSATLLDQPRPYLYVYKREDIRNWVQDVSDPMRYQSVLLRDYIYEYDEETGFPKGTNERYRHLWMQDGVVHAALYDADMVLQTKTVLNIQKLPFIPIQISQSLMMSIADYQIALLNLASSDLYYALKSNFPFYTEQYDPAALASWYQKPEGNPDADYPGTSVENVAKTREVSVGTTTGRAYPTNTDRPGFIAPPSEPLKASMEKQGQLKEEIRLLLNLAISNLRPQRASADSKTADDRGLESGLSYIGLTLETAERSIAEVWNQYENVEVPVSIKYPKEYSLKTDSERREEALELDNLRLKIPSTTYQKEVSKIISNILLSHKVDRTTLDKIESEIDSAPCVTGDPDSIRQDVEAGILDIELASKLRLYPEGTAAKAKADRTERLVQIKDSQTPALGARGIDPEEESGKDEKELSRDTSDKADTTDRTRGEGK